MKNITVNESVTLHQHYRGYLQIAAIDLMRANAPTLWLLHWDPTQPVATRPLSLRKNGTWYTYGHDLTKNVMELYTTAGAIVTEYDYTPYGTVTATGLEQPIQWSSEHYDAELALVYYNYRHYNPLDGRWINRDPIMEQGGANLYGFVKNTPWIQYDHLGNEPNTDLLSPTDKQWTCESARRQLEAQVQSWRGYGYGLPAYFLEKFLDKNTPALVPVPEKYITDFLDNSGDTLCQDLEKYIPAYQGVVENYNGLSLRYLIKDLYMFYSYGGMKIDFSIRKLGANLLSATVTIKDTYIFDTGTKGEVSAMLNASYSAARFMERSCRDTISTFESIAKFDILCRCSMSLLGSLGLDEAEMINFELGPIHPRYCRQLNGLDYNI